MNILSFMSLYKISMWLMTLLVKIW